LSTAATMMVRVGSNVMFRVAIAPERGAARFRAFGKTILTRRLDFGDFAEAFVVFGAHDPHGASRQAHDAFGCGAEHEALQAAAAMRSDDDEIGVEVRGELHELFGGGAEAEVRIEFSERQGLSGTTADFFHACDRVMLDPGQGRFRRFAPAFRRSEVIVDIEHVQFGMSSHRQTQGFIERMITGFREIDSDNDRVRLLLHGRDS